MSGEKIPALIYFTISIISRAGGAHCRLWPDSVSAPGTGIGEA